MSNRVHFAVSDGTEWLMPDVLVPRQGEHIDFDGRRYLVADVTITYWHDDRNTVTVVRLEPAFTCPTQRGDGVPRPGWVKRLRELAP